MAIKSQNGRYKKTFSNRNLLADTGRYFVTFTVIHWIDLFSRKKVQGYYYHCFLKLCKEKGLVAYGWVIMSNHIHLIITTKTEEENILAGDKTIYYL